MHLPQVDMRARMDLELLMIQKLETEDGMEVILQ